MQGTYIEANQANFTRGRNGRRVEFIILHTMGGFMTGTIAWFKNPAAKVTAHFLVSTDGVVVQMVPKGDTAWHAGTRDINERSVGIETEDKLKPFGARSSEQNETVAQLVAETAKEFNIPLDTQHILQHKEVNPKKPNCPGSVDREWVIARARQINGMPTNLPTPTPSLPITPHGRNVLVIPDRGLNIRSSTTTTQKNITRVLIKGTSISVEGYVFGESISGNNIWWKVKDKQEFAWSGATNFVPTPPSLAATTPVTVAAQNPKSPADNPEALKLKIQALEEQVKTSVKNYQDLDLFSEELKKQKKIVDDKLLEFGNQNFETVKLINEELLRKNRDLTQQRNDAYIKAFEDWSLFEVPTGVKGSTVVLSLIARLFKFSSQKHYVVGWKEGATLHRVDGLEDAIAAQDVTEGALQ